MRITILSLLILAMAAVSLPSCGASVDHARVGTGGVSSVEVTRTIRINNAGAAGASEILRALNEAEKGGGNAGSR